MTLIPNGAFVDPRPFGLPADSREIILEFPIAPSANRLYRQIQRSSRVFKTKLARDWEKAVDGWILLKHQYPKEPITGPFEVEILLSQTYHGDGDNRIKATLDYLQSRQIIRNDRDCRKGRWAWVRHDQAPIGCRVIIRTLHD